MNVGTIVEAPVMRVRLGRGKALGEVEEYFVAMLTPGDTFIFAGRLLRFEGMRDNEVMVSARQGAGRSEGAGLCRRQAAADHALAERVRRSPGRALGLASAAAAGRRVAGGAARRSVLTAPDELLVETFARGGRHYLVAYCFAGRNAHQTLGMLLTRRMERRGPAAAGLRRLGLLRRRPGACEPVGDVAGLFDVDILGDDLEEWMAESSLLKRTFRNCAVVAGPDRAAPSRARRRPAGR